MSFVSRLMLGVRTRKNRVGGRMHANKRQELVAGDAGVDEALSWLGNDVSITPGKERSKRQAYRRTFPDRGVREWHRPHRRLVHIHRIPRNLRATSSNTSIKLTASKRGKGDRSRWNDESACQMFTLFALDGVCRADRLHESSHALQCPALSQENP